MGKNQQHERQQSLLQIKMFYLRIVGLKKSAAWALAADIFIIQGKTYWPIAGTPAAGVACSAA